MRRLKLTYAACTVFLLFVASLSCSGNEPERPDVLLITLDTTRRDYVSAYGAGRVRTPHIDSVAARGILFTNAFTTAPMTLPAHASLMTGLYPPTHGVRNNGMYMLDEGVTTLAGTLRLQGYATAAVTGSFVLHSQFGLDSGFESYDDEFGERGGAGLSFSYLERDAGSVTDVAVSLLGKMRSPRFLWVHYFDPHHPHTPPSPFDSEYGEDLYAGEIAYVDACAGKLLEAAREASGGKELLIVIAGDHGEDLGDHGEMAHGIFLYDSTVKIPLVMACPDRLPAGITHESPASLVDVFPTILDILNVEPEGISVQGKSLLESLSRSDEPERALYLETMMPLENNGWSPLSAVIAGRYKYIRAPKPELYHTGSDPGERDNLLESEREESRLMVQLLDSLTESLSSKAWAAAREMDEETREKLASLGYVMGQERSGRTLHDPKDMLPVLKEEQKGLSLYQAGDHSGAERAFAEALAMDPTNVTLLHYRALSLFALGRVRESILLWEKALALTPGYLDLRLNLGMAQLALGAPDSALASYGEVLDANPRYIKALVGTGMALRVKGLHEEAHKAFARAVQYSPRNAEARLWLGISKGEMGDRQGALRELEEARLLDPALEAASREKAIILSSLGRTEESVAILERLASKNPSSSRFVDLGYALEVAGRLEEALRAYRQAIRLSSDSYMAYSNAGSVLDRLGRPEEAEHSLRQALSINEDFPQAHYTLGFLLRRLGRQEEAKRELMRFLELWKADDEATMRAREALGEKASVLSP